MRGSALRLVQEIYIGRADGDEHYVFGRLTDITLNSNDDLLVLDGGYKVVRLYNSSGDFLFTFGHEGEGPGEFFHPTAVAVDEIDQVYVASQSKISIFDSSGQFVKDFRHGIPDCYARGLRVATGDGIYVSCLDILEQRIIHKYGDRDYRPLVSFSESYAKGKDIDTRIESTYGGGVIDLSSDRQTVFYSQLNPYEIRLFSASGALVRVIHRDNDFMTAPKVETLPDGSVHFGGLSGSSAIIALSDGRFLNIVRLVEPTSEGHNTIVDLFSSDGALLATVREERRLNLKCVDSLGRLYGADLDDYPRIARLRMEGSP